MRVTLLPSSPHDPEGSHFLISFLVDGRIAIDAGSLGLHGTPREQASVQHVFLTHSHADHVGSLPIFLENTGRFRERPVTVHGSEATLESLRRDMFNGRVWPELARLRGSNGPVLTMHVLEPEHPVLVDGLRIIPVPVNHVIPTFGFVIEGPAGSVAFGADSGPTERIWKVGRGTKRLRAVFMECTFPDSLEEHAGKTGHLCPRTFGLEIGKLPPQTDVIAVHVRAAYRKEVEEQLFALAGPRIRIAMGGGVYEF